MNNYRKISFDIDFAGKKVLNTIQMPLEELTQNDFNSSLLTLKLMQGQELINLQGLSVVLNFLMPSGKDYVDTINAEMIDIENSIVSYSIPKDILSEVGMVVGTVSLYKEGYRYTSIVQFKFEVVSDFVEDREIVESDNYPILAQMIGEVQNLKDEEMKRVESEIERIENEEERESSELQREMNEVERHEAENVRIINEQNREVKELERDQAERLREANSAKVKREEETRLEAETLRVQAESLRIGAESDRIQAESIRQMQESDRHEKELERQAAESLRVLAEIEREQKQNEFNARAEEVAVRIEEESQRIGDLVEIEESKLVKPRDMMDYMGNQHNSLKEKADSDVDYAVKTAIGEFNYLDYEGQHITVNNSIEGHTKSAILSGCTLVSLGNDKIDKSFTYDLTVNILSDVKNLKPNTNYIILMGHSASSDRNVLLHMYRNDWSYIGNQSHIISPTKKYIKFTSPNDVVCNFQLQNISQETFTGYDLMLLEYQDGMENWDIPYFEGMKSVKMPVLTTTGKNLFNPKWLKNENTESVLRFEDDGSITLNGELKFLTWFYFDLPKGTYQASSFNDSLNAFHVFWEGADDYFETRKYFTLNEDTPIKGYIAKGNYDNYNIKLQLETGTQKTSYEPFKSNILSTPSDLELRGIGDVQDELNLITGELTENVKKMTLNGSENWTLNGTYSNFIELVGIGKLKDSTVGFCDKLPKVNITASSENNPVGFMMVSHDGVRLKLLEGNDNSLEDYKQWLKENPVTIYFLPQQKSIKTVDLSDNVVYSYNGTTHYSCSSEEGSLVPTLSVKVPTDVQEVISEQRKIISEQEEAQNILIDSQLSLYESISGVQTLQTDGEEVQMPQYIIDLYELAYKRGIRKKGER